MVKQTNSTSTSPALATPQSWPQPSDAGAQFVSSMDPPAHSNMNLTDLRKKLGRITSDLHHAESHAQFTQDCIQNNTTPKGLAIKTLCHAFHIEITN